MLHPYYIMQGKSYKQICYTQGNACALHKNVESDACVHSVILSYHTRFLAQMISTHFNATYSQITIQLGIQTLQTNKLTILSTIVSSLSRSVSNAPINIMPHYPTAGQCRGRGA